MMQIAGNKYFVGKCNKWNKTVIKFIFSKAPTVKEAFKSFTNQNESFPSDNRTKPKNWDGGFAVFITVRACEPLEN